MMPNGGTRERSEVADKDGGDAGQHPVAGNRRPADEQGDVVGGGDAVGRAWERLGRAVTGLETAAHDAASRAQAQAEDLRGARAEAAALRETQELLRQRLDAAISRLRALLQSPGQ